MKTFNLNADEWDGTRDREGWRAKGALVGGPTLRTPEGEQVLKEGDVVCFPRGKNGAHQIINRTDAPIRVLMLSSMIRGEIIEYLDTRKVLAKDVEDEDITFARPGPTVEYWEGED